MKLDEDFGPDHREDAFQTDDEENQAHTICQHESDSGSDNTGPMRTMSNQSVDANNQTWPKSYRESMDMLSGLTSPSLSFLKGGSQANITPSLTSAYRRRQGSEGDFFLDKPLIPETTVLDGEASTSALPIDLIASPSLSFIDIPQERKSSLAQACFNGINVLCGVGLLTTPYAVKEGGWLSLLILILFAVICCYTGIWLTRCLESASGLKTYPDLGQAAFGVYGRIAVSLSCSVGGVGTSILVALCLLWVGVVDKVGFHPSGTLLDLGNLPVAVGIYGFGFSGHSVFPNIYASMKDPSGFPVVLFVSFVFCGFMYAGVAVCGFLMFGESTESQYTLNMPEEFVASNIAVWTAVVNPMTKYALNMTPVALCLEELMPSGWLRTYSASLLIRTILVASTLVVALSVPFFGFMMALMGSLLAMLVAVIFPSVCYLKLLGKKSGRLETAACVCTIFIGLLGCCIGTYSSILKIADEYS
ncbi:hypothetical protein Tsubulata_028908 [Turnera subulata]|uniref:Amino acid transporter transmembrane domain-containing protein n=1 Tax=Turnera subulata TaxID=218843 RepID=A0A9Q0GFA0_9ROSI|nr:hypothetical protein Tsubulata_028908 [Turnera subulata]